MSQRLIRISELASRPDRPGKLPVSPATIWRWVKAGKFPKPFKIGDATTVWDADLVESFLANKAAEVKK